MSVYFTLNIESGNAAFADDPTFEVLRILKKATANLRTGDYPIQDINGNTCGEVIFFIDEDEDPNNLW